MYINKYPSFVSAAKYTKLYRLPRWIYKKVVNGTVDPEKEYIISMRLGHQIRLKPTQRYLSNIIYSGQYHDDNIFLLSRFVKKNSVVLDIGANIGLYCCAFARFCKHLDLKIHAIEAIKNNYEALKNNVSLNRFDNIKSYNLALGKERGKLRFVLPSKDIVGNFAGGNVYRDEEDIKKATESSVTIEAEMVTLDDWANEHNINECDVIKIDIEGAEYFAFQGGREFIKKTRPVILSEYNEPILENINVSFSDYISIFKELDYKIAYERDNDFLFIEDIEQFKPHQTLLDLLLVPSEKLSQLH